MGFFQTRCSGNGEADSLRNDRKKGKGKSKGRSRMDSSPKGNKHLQWSQKMQKAAMEKMERRDVSHFPTATIYRNRKKYFAALEF
jgi:hypothetical protein